jgi:hypothetical protein
VTPLTFVCWKWSKPGYRSTFGPNAVNTLRKMVARHYDAPHRFCCVTDDAEGLDPEVEVIPDWTDFAALPAPSAGVRSEYRRRVWTSIREHGLGPRDHGRLEASSE